MPMIEKTATITTKGQTTVPKAVRQALGADYGGKITWRIDDNGVSVNRLEDDQDPALGPFLNLLENHIASHPSALSPITAEIRTKIQGLSHGVVVDLSTPIEGDVAI